MENVQVIFEFDQSIIACEDTELDLLVTHQDTKTCHGIVTLRKVVELDDKKGELIANMRKRRAPSQTVVVVERMKRRYECAHCD